MKILILKPSSLGDVIHALPVLRLLKQQLPQAEIHWWIDAGLAPLLEGDPDLSAVVHFERRRWAKPIYWPEMWRSIHWLRAQHYDWVIDLQCLARSAMFAWLANGKLLIGRDDTREGAPSLYDIVVQRTVANMHAVDWCLAVLPRLGVPVHFDFTWLPERPAVSRSVKQKWNPGNARWVALQPGARWTTKRWPIAHFAELAQLVANEFPGVRLAVVGGKDDRGLGETISQAVPGRCLNLAGETSLPEMIEWLRLCSVLVTNDTGPAHVAAALGKPVISMFGPTDPQETGPYGQSANVLRHQLPCAPCRQGQCRWVHPIECLSAITPALVASRVRAELLRNGG